MLIDIYLGSPQLVYLFELLLDLDEGFQEWRYRHVKMVERMIGEKYGTGGSEGVGYLKTTLFKPFFPDLWTIRTELQNQ
jgi:tryptophan 2,3-dioxygenase